jgi:hypothetical protein
MGFTVEGKKTVNGFSSQAPHGFVRDYLQEISSNLEDIGEGS